MADGKRTRNPPPSCSNGRADVDTPSTSNHDQCASVPETLFEFDPSTVQDARVGDALSVSYNGTCLSPRSSRRKSSRTSPKNIRKCKKDGDGPLCGRRILLVEDVNSIRMLGKRMMERAGATCCTAADGRIAVDAVQVSCSHCLNTANSTLCCIVRPQADDFFRLLNLNRFYCVPRTLNVIFIGRCSRAKAFRLCFDGFSYAEHGWLRVHEAYSSKPWHTSATHIGVHSRRND